MKYMVSSVAGVLAFYASAVPVTSSTNKLFCICFYSGRPADFKCWLFVTLEGARLLELAMSIEPYIYWILVKLLTKSRYKSMAAALVSRYMNICQTSSKFASSEQYSVDICSFILMTVQCKTQIFHSLFEAIKALYIELGYKDAADKHVCFTVIV